MGFCTETSFSDFNHVTRCHGTVEKGQTKKEEPILPDLTDLIDHVHKILKFIFGNSTPSPILWIVRGVVGLIFLLFLVSALLDIAARIKNRWVESFLPLFYNREEKRRSRRRGRFAEHVESEIRRINNLESWQDFQFSELEAEVEANGKRKVIGFLPFYHRTRSGLRRESSLSRALQSSDERLILLEGDPGSGKSVALRHVTLLLANRVRKHPSTKNVIPIFVNLKDLRRSPGEKIDKNLIHSFIIRTLNRINDRDIEEILEEEFDKGCREGTWLFLFDSFDEIPEVLSATSSSINIRNYAEAISDFLHGMNLCKGIVASRQFRSPDLQDWPLFQIKDLSERRRIQLIKKADLPPEIEKNLFRNLMAAEPEIQAMTRNPMFLGLLCLQAKSEKPFPQNTHAVLESHIVNRLNHDRERILQRFNLKIGEIQIAAENIAFCMGIDPELGLNPSRLTLRASLNRFNLEINDKFETLCDALEYVKLARAELSDPLPGESRSFTFAHRRFQEYFATCVVLRNPAIVSSRQLLTDGRWRETAVTLFQTQPLDNLRPILEETDKLINAIMNGIPNLIDDPFAFVNKSLEEELEKLQGSYKRQPNTSGFPVLFPWPDNTLHILDIMQTGFGRRVEEVPSEIRAHSAQIILSASAQGALIDQKWALEVAGILPPFIFSWLLQNAFDSDSEWLKDIAYRQVSRLAEISDGIAESIRQQLIHSSLGGSLNRKKYETEAFLARLDKPESFLSVMNLLLWIPFVAVISNILTILIVTLAIFPSQRQLIAGFILSIVSLFLIFMFKFIRLGLTSIVIALNTIIVVILIFTTQSNNSLPSLRIVLLALLYVYFAFWALCAYWSAKTGKMSRFYWWPFLPLVWLINAIVWIPRSLIYIFKDRKKLVNFIQSSSVPIIILVMMLIFGNYLKKYSNIVLITIGVIGVIPVSIALFSICKQAYEWFYDRVKWYYWRKKNRGTISLKSLLEAFNKCKTPKFCANIMNFTRESRRLERDNETESELQELAFAVEYALKNKIKEDETIRWNAKSHFVTDWLTKYTKSDKKRLSKLGPEFLDELYMQIEQIKAVNMNIG